MKSWEVLAEEEMADEAEKAVFRSSLSTPPKPISDGGFKTYEELGRMDADRNAATLSRLAAAKPADPVRDVGEEYLVKAGGNAVGHGFDVLEAAASPVMYGAKKLLGSGPNDERALGASLGKPIDNLVTGARNLYGSASELLGGPLTPDAKPKFRPDENLTGEHVKEGVQEFGVMTDPNAPTWDRFKAGGKIALRTGAALYGNAPSAIGGLSRAAGAIERGALSAGGRLVGDIVSSAPRRGVLDLGRAPHTPEQEKWKKVADAAEELVNGDSSKGALSESKQAKYERLTAGIFEDDAKLARFAAMDPDALKVSLQDNFKIAGRRDRSMARESIDEIAGEERTADQLFVEGQRAGGGMGAGRGTARAAQGLSEDTVAMLRDDAIAKAKAYQSNPTYDAENAFLDAYVDLPDGAAASVNRELGIKRGGLKQDKIASVEAWLKSAQNETPPGFSPNANGIEAADDLAMAARSEEAASGQRASLASDVFEVYDQGPIAARGSVEAIRQRLDSATKPELLEAARAVEMVSGKNMSRSVLADEIAKRIEARHSVGRRAHLGGSEAENAKVREFSAADEAMQRSGGKPADDIPVYEPGMGPSSPDGPSIMPLPATPRAAPEAINKKTWYHGSGTSGITHENVTPEATDIESLFGEGVYLTDNPSIAKGYAKARSRATNEPTIYQAKVEVGRTLDLEQPSPPEVRSLLQKVSNSLTETGFESEPFNDAFSKAMKNPSATTESLYRALASDMGDYSHATMTSKAEISDVTNAVTDGLRKAGYDALTHTGGRRTGKAPHQVLIVLDPHDLSMTGRSGHIKEFTPMPPNPAAQAPGGLAPAGGAPPPSPIAPGGGGPSSPDGPMLPVRWQASPPAKRPPLEGQWEPGGPSGPPAASRTIDAEVVPPPERNETGFATNMIESLENAALKANNPAGRQLAEKGREIVNYGETKAAGPVKRSNDLAAKLSPAERQEISELFTPQAYEDLGAGRLLFGKFQANVDGNAVKMLIDPSETRLAPGGQAFADDYVLGMKEIGDEAKALGVINVKGRPVQPAEGRRFIQGIDPSAKEWMVDGDPDFEDLIELIHKIRPDKTPQSLREALTTFAQQPLDRPAPIEFVRDLEMMPAAMVGRDGKIKPILRHIPIPHANSPKSPTAASIQSQWMRMGGIKHIGQDVTEAVADGYDSLGNIVNQKLGPALAAGGPDVVTAAEGMLSAIYHRPVKGTLLNTFNTAMADTPLMKSRSTLMQSLRSMQRIFPTMNLSRVWAVSMPQTAGEVAAVTGFGNYGKSLMEVARRHGMSVEAAEQAGAIQRKFLEAGSEVYDQHRLLESVLNANANRFPTEKLNDFVKDLNDTIAFTAGKFKGEEMLSKGAKQSDFLLMDEMNLPDSVKRVFRNPSAHSSGEQADAVNSFGRSVSKETQFHAKNPAMKGRFENDQVLKFALPYQSYSINTLKRSLKDFERVWRAAAPETKSAIGFGPLDFTIDAVKRLDPRNLGREPVQNALKRLATRLVGMEVSGEVVADISSTGQGKDPLRRDRSALARALENLSYVGFLGPLHVGFDWATAWMLGSDPEAQKRSLTGKAGSRVPEVGNPFASAVWDAGNKLRKGDVGGAAWELTGGQMPIVSGLGRASGAMEPSGAKKPTVGGERRKSPFSDLFETKGATKRKGPFSDFADPPLEGKKGRRKGPFSDL